MPKKPFGVLILHGFTSSLECVSEIEPPMKKLGLPTRMPILRGHCAESPEALRGVTWPMWMEDGEKAMQSLLKEADKVIIVSLSMGGLVALTLAAEHPDKVDSIVLAAAAVRLVSPLAPHHPLAFLQPVVKLLLKKWDSPAVRADPSLLPFDNNYRYTPMDALMSFLEFTKVTEKRLPEVHVPALILQSRKDTTVEPETANLIYNSISTPKKDKKIIWYEVTEHEMFRDCERSKVIGDVEKYVKGRIGK
jgi:carboxylesterase